MYIQVRQAAVGLLDDRGVVGARRRVPMTQQDRSNRTARRRRDVYIHTRVRAVRCSVSLQPTRRPENKDWTKARTPHQIEGIPKGFPERNGGAVHARRPSINHHAIG